MLNFEPITQKSIKTLREYYKNGLYRLCGYSFGCKFLWKDRLNSEYAQVENCLVVRHCVNGEYQFSYPLPKENGDINAALTAIEKWCTKTGNRLIFSETPIDKASLLLQRYPLFNVSDIRKWKEYLYCIDDLISYKGKTYHGQRNHLNKFRKEYPDARYISALSSVDNLLVEHFWKDYESEFQKSSSEAKNELILSKNFLSEFLNTEDFHTGGLELDEKLIALILGEVCGETLVIHIEKGLYSVFGVYPVILNSFVTDMKNKYPNLKWVNLEDDNGDKGLRNMKLQYHPAELLSNVCFSVENELDSLTAQPVIKTERLTLDSLQEKDKSDYNALCLDDENNRWWGYDYRKDVKEEDLTEDYFLDVAHNDFKAHLSVNFAVRLDGRCIGEAILYEPDWRGGMELGVRISKDFHKNGYGKEVFAAVSQWAIYTLGLYCVNAKCYKENIASYKMISSCMKLIGDDDEFYYFERHA